MQYKKLPVVCIDAYTAMEIDATRYGDQLAQIALRMADSLPAFDSYVDAVAGHDVAMSASAQMMDLASEAAGGSTNAFNQLIDSLVQQGMTTQQATSAASSMAAVMYEQGMATGQATTASEGLQEALMANDSAYKAAVESANGMSDAVQRFSDTDLNLEATARLNVEVEGAAKATADISGSFSTSTGGGGFSGNYDYGNNSENALGAIYSYHARGGIMTDDTVFHIGGEKGSEAILPLRSPDQVNIIEDKIDSIIKNSEQSALAFVRQSSGADPVAERLDKLIGILNENPDRPVVVQVTGDERGLRQFIRVEADSQIDDRNSRDLAHGRVAY